MAAVSVVLNGAERTAEKQGNNQILNGHIENTEVGVYDAVYKVADVIAEKLVKKEVGDIELLKHAVKLFGKIGYIEVVRPDYVYGFARLARRVFNSAHVRNKLALVKIEAGKQLAAVVFDKIVYSLVILSVLNLGGSELSELYKELVLHLRFSRLRRKVHSHRHTHNKDVFAAVLGVTQNKRSIHVYVSAVAFLRHGGKRGVLKHIPGQSRIYGSTAVKVGVVRTGRRYRSRLRIRVGSASRIARDKYRGQDNQQYQQQHD